MFHNCKNSDDAKTLYRRLAKILHPDIGGSSDLMILMQESYERFIEKNALKNEIEEKYYGGFAYSKKKENKNNDLKNKYPGKYQDVDNFIRSEDLESIYLFYEILQYSKHHKSFDSRFIISVYDTLMFDKMISAKAYNSCLKVYYAFHMHTWFKQNEEKCRKSA